MNTLLVSVLLIAAHARNITDNEATPLPQKFLSAKIEKALAPAGANGSIAKDALAPAITSFGNDATSAEMEAAVTDLLAGKGAFAATPMGGSVKQIRDIISKTMMVKVTAAHRSDQATLKRLNDEINRCGNVKRTALAKAKPRENNYKLYSGRHKSCRSSEAVKRSSMNRCRSEERSMKSIKNLKCNLYAAAIRNYGTQKANTAVVRKAGSEKTESYIRRISSTFCGSHVHGSKGKRRTTGGWGGGLPNSYLDKYLKAKDACNVATRNYNNKVKECRTKTRQFNSQKSKCNTYQTLMDSNSCANAVSVKDACESYVGCYQIKVKAYRTFEKAAKSEEKDRKAEWRGLKRMGCLIDAFADGKVKDAEINTCKKRTVNTNHLTLKYYRIPKRQICVVPNLYPSTGPYLRREFAPLPSLAKGKTSAACTGLEEISTRPRKGSPRSCRCTRVTLNGPYSAGAMVKCTNCWDVRRSTQRNSCPIGTKLFSPASRSDWDTFRKSTGRLSAPHFIVDVTKPRNGCYGCRSAMNSRNSAVRAWTTSDGSPWWLRSRNYGEPNGDYHANCYLGIWNTHRTNDIRYNDASCGYHSKSYYCQLTKMNLEPNPGSPRSCKCTKVKLAGPYSGGSLVKCSHCLTVHNSRQKNSCPKGMKLFAPRSSRDWKTVLNSGGVLNAPHFIVDVTRPQNGCGGCTRHSMNSRNRYQASWRTSDGSPWYLRNSRFGEPNGDYTANCYLHVYNIQGNGDVKMNDHRCHYRSNSYYCQPRRR